MKSEDYGKLHTFSKNQEDKSMLPIASFSFQEGLNTVGRAAQVQKYTFEISGDQYMSRPHFTIEVRKDSLGRVHYILFDNGSTNGTFINCRATKVQKKLTPQDRIKVDKGDQIKAGSTYFEIEPPKISKDSISKEDTAPL